MMTLKTLYTRIKGYKRYIERNEHVTKNSKNKSHTYSPTINITTCPSSHFLKTATPLKRVTLVQWQISSTKSDKKKLGVRFAYQSPLPKSQKSGRFVHLVGYIYYSYI